MDRLAQEIHVPESRINGILAGERSISGETALRLGRYFGTIAACSINMHARYDLETARVAFQSCIQSEIRPAARLTRQPDTPPAQSLLSST